MNVCICVAVNMIAAGHGTRGQIIYFDLILGENNFRFPWEGNWFYNTKVSLAK